MEKMIATRPLSIEIDGERQEIPEGGEIVGADAGQIDSLIGAGWALTVPIAVEIAETTSEPLVEPLATVDEQPSKKRK